MPRGKKAEKPIYNYLDINTIYDDIITAAYNNITLLGYDINNPKERKSITHNEVNYIFRQIYNALFKPSKALYNNQKSLIDYDNIELLNILIDAFIDICSSLNKSLGIMSFSYMSGIDYTTLYLWGKDEKSNPARFKAIKRIQETHKAAQISLLNDSPVGALAVANNDTETGLQWSLNQTITAANNAVFLIPSERLNRLNIGNAEPLRISAEDRQKQPEAN